MSQCSGPMSAVILLLLMVIVMAMLLLVLVCLLIGDLMRQVHLHGRVVPVRGGAAIEHGMLPRLMSALVIHVEDAPGWGSCAGRSRGRGALGGKADSPVIGRRAASW